MSNLPKHIYWAIENQTARSIDALYRRKICILARAFSIPITLLNASDSPKFFGGLGLSKKKLAELHDQREKIIQQQLEDLQALFTKKHVEVSYQIITERPFFKAAINLVKQNENAWMIAQSSKKIGISNIVWQFIRHCHIPVYIAKEKDWQLPLNILAAIDPIHENDKTAALDHKILTTAIDIAHHCQANLHVVHCYSPLVLTEHSLQKRVKELHRDNFREAINAFKIDSNRTHLVSGDPVEKIEQLCETLDIDLVIMGAVSRNSIERIFIGSTVEEILPKIESDVLLIRL